MKNNQGKTPKQNKDSRKFAFIGILGLVVITASLLGIGHYTGFNQEVEQGLQNDTRPLSPLWNYLPPKGTVNDSLPYDTVEWEDMMDIDMDCGDSYYDSIPGYDSFNNVPASMDTVIRVDGILYKKNNNKTSWIPVYPDEYVMWVGNNGDTIWE